MNKLELLKKLKELKDNDDIEISHGEADRLLLDYIDDEDITDAFEKLERWYG